ncbi:hypothetical protein BBJ28_00014233 [Nothophytophthora sp. Chile5]|nr:hypothetical protein BBJ28_00014233 [Nothophytophthora sp. Chile5]
MGTCASRAAPKSPRQLANWKVEEGATQEAAEGRDATHVSDVAVGIGAEENDLALNCVSYCSELRDDCLTGWEDGSIRRTNWRTRRSTTLKSGSEDNSDVIASWKPHARAVNRLVIGELSQNVYSCSRDTTVAITSLSRSDSSQVSTVLRGHQLNVATVAVDTTEQSVCSGGRDTQTIFWDVATARMTAKNTTPQNVVTCSTWLPGESLVAQGSEDLSVKLWDPRTPLRVPVETLRGFVYFPLSIAAYSGDGDSTYLLTSSKGFNGVGCEARVWDRRTGKQLLEFQGHQQDATACCFLPNLAGGIEEEALPVLPVTASKDGAVKVWDAAARNPLAEVHAGGMFTDMCAVDSDTLLACTFGGQVHAYLLDRQQRTLALLSQQNHTS